MRWRVKRSLVAGLALLVAAALLAACETGAKPPPRRGDDAGVTDTVGGLAGRIEAEWRDVDFPADGITVSLPGAPRENRFTLKAGGIEVPESTWVLGDKGVTFMVTIARLPPELLDLPMTIDEMLTKEARHYLALDPHEIVNRQDVRVDHGDLPGLDTTVEALLRGKAVMIHQRVYARRERRYCLSTSYRPEVRARAEAGFERMLASVRFR